MPRVILFDIDGIVMVGRKKLFSEALAEHQGILPESVQEFFANDFKKCSFGRGDLKVEITPYLEKWKWNGSVEDLLEFWFKIDGEKSAEILEIIASLRENGVKCYIAIRQEKYRLDYLLNTVGLKNYFDGVFCTCGIGFDKDDPQFFRYVFKELDMKPEEIMFFDDRQANIDNAKSLGIQAYFYENVETLKERIKDLT